MSAIRLLVLGAIRRRKVAHGYQVRSDLETWGAHEWSNAAPGSIYHALKSMAAQGLLTDRNADSEAGGPRKTEYELTAAGEAEFFVLLRDALSSRDPRLDLLAAAVGFLDDLTRVEAVELLQSRARSMEVWRESIVSHLPPGTRLESWGPVGEVIGLWLHTAESRLRWTEGLIERLKAGAHALKGDPT